MKRNLLTATATIAALTEAGALVARSSGFSPDSKEFADAVRSGDAELFTRALTIETRADDGSSEIENVKAADGEAFEFDALASVGTRRLMWHPRHGLVWEELEISEAAVDLTTFNARGMIPFYREHIHSSWAQLGAVRELEIQPGKLYARKIKLSRRDDVKGYRQDVFDGIQGGVSLGYRHKEATIIDQGDEDYPILRVSKIEPVELSAASMPADIYCGIIEASVRSAETNDGVPDGEALIARSAAADGTTAAHKEGNIMDETTTVPTGTETVTRSEAPVIATAPAVTPAPAPAFDAGAFAARSAELVTIASQAGLATDVLTRAIADPSVTVDAFRSQAFAAMVARQSPAITAGNDVAARGDRTSAIVDAIVARATGSAPAAGSLAREYMNVGLNDMAHEMLTQSGQTVSRHDRDEIYVRTFHGTSDFPNIMASAIRKILVEVGSKRDLEYTKVARKQNLRNFQGTKLVDFDNFPTLKRLRENGEISRGSIGDGGTEVFLQTFARAMRITRQAWVNDDLGVLTNVASLMGSSIPDFQNDLVFAVLQAAALNVAGGGDSDLLLPGVNLLANNAALNSANINAAIALMGERQRRDGSTANVKPKFLVTGYQLRDVALKETSAVLATATGDVNINTDLVPILDGNIKGKSWFLTADPNGGNPPVHYGFRDGQEGPMVQPWTKVPGFDGYEAEVILDFYAATTSSFGIAGAVDDSIAD